VVWIRSPVGNDRDIKIVVGIADPCEFGIAAFLETAALAVVGGGVSRIVAGGIDSDTVGPFFD